MPTINKNMLKVRIEIKDRNQTDRSKRIKKKCMHEHVITHMILAHNPLLPPFVFTNERAQILGNAYMYYINGCQIHFKHERTGVSSRSKWLTF